MLLSILILPCFSDWTFSGLPIFCSCPLKLLPLQRMFKIPCVLIQELQVEVLLVDLSHESPFIPNLDLNHSYNQNQNQKPHPHPYPQHHCQREQRADLVWILSLCEMTDCTASQPTTHSLLCCGKKKEDSTEVSWEINFVSYLLLWKVEI